MLDYRVTNALEWLNGNMHRNYPIADSAVPVALDGKQYLPSSFITDLQLVVPYVEGIDPSRFFISSIVRNVNSFQVTIGYMTVDPTQTTDVYGFDCAVSAPIPMDMEYTGESANSIELAGITTVPATIGDSYTYGVPEEYAAMRGIRGTVYIGSCRDMATIGAMQFRWANTAIMPTCVYIERAVEELRSLRIIDNYGTDATFTQDLTLRMQDGVTANLENGVLTFGIDDRYIEARLAEILQSKYGSVIKTVNGAAPDVNGNITITGLDCTSITATEHGISISNPCAKPCCDSGNVDSAEIQAALEQLNNDKLTLTNYYTDLATNVNAMQSRMASLIASRR